MNLILLEPGEVDATGTVSLTGARADHLLDVLHAAPGQTVRVGLLDGPCGVGTVRSIVDRRVELGVAVDGVIPPRPAVDVLLALPRPKVLRRLWAQLAAIGVGQIILTNAERVERHYFDTHVLTPECYRPLLIEGLQQARDTRLPAVSIHKRLKPLVEDDLSGLFSGGLRLVGQPGGGSKAASLIRARSRESADGRVLLAIGPEGGWNAFELALLQSHHFQPVAMRDRTLRTDTACIALLALVHEAMTS